jgi:hypothetical protein
VTITFRDGRLPHDANPARLLFADYLRTAPAPPAAADWFSSVRSWPALLNDKLGDCTAAAAGHAAQQVNRYGRDQDAPVTDADTLAMYRAISGYVPGQPRTDVGATLQAALDYWRNTGIGGNRIAAFAQIKATDLDAIRLAIARFGSVYAGMWISQSAMDQFNQGKPWTVAGRSANLGGHCVPVMGYDANSFSCITWTRVQPMTVEFFRAQFDEIWVPIDLDWMRTNGVSPAGIDTAALNADYQALTGKPGPFPNVTPTPVPVPVPTPKPTPIGPRSSDVALAATFDNMAAAFDNWRHAAGV